MSGQQNQNYHPVPPYQQGYPPQYMYYQGQETNGQAQDYNYPNANLSSDSTNISSMQQEDNMDVENSGYQHQHQHDQAYDERQYYNDNMEQEQMRQMFMNPPRQNTKISLDDFTMIKVIGKGSYAKVVLVKKRDDGQVYAIKMLKKSYIEQKKQVEHIKAERNILVNADHPFIIKMHYSFHNERKLFFVLDYCQGGELFNLLAKKNRFDELLTKFYSAQIVLALEYLHNQDIIYRDLKPENVLIDRFGYLKITDFGLSKRFSENQKNLSICGTPEYLAPEVLMKLGHGKPVDWWTLGCLIYELLTGLPPFYSDDRRQLFQAIQQQRCPPISSQIKVSAECQDLIARLLEKDPAKRLGTKGAIEIKKHPFFVNVNWDTLLARAVSAPFVPKLLSATDTQNFDPEFTKMDFESYSNGINSLENTNQVAYTGFSYQGDIGKM